MIMIHYIERCKLKLNRESLIILSIIFRSLAAMGWDSVEMSFEVTSFVFRGSNHMSAHVWT